MDLGGITEAVVFYVFAALGVLAALGVVIARTPVRSALSLAVVFLSLAVMYLLLNAPFIAVAQVMIYAGAVLILFLFVIMVLNPRLELGIGTLSTQTVAAFGITVVLIVELAIILSNAQLAPATGQFTPEFVSQAGHVQVIGSLLFSEFLLPFEIASMLLLVAIVGAISLAKRVREETRR
jgi:NADH-quinone oxidoreductase subunit J